jgi:hypothetical protein
MKNTMRVRQNVKFKNVIGTAHSQKRYFPGIEKILKEIGKRLVNFQHYLNHISTNWINFHNYLNTFTSTPLLSVSTDE